MLQSDEDSFNFKYLSIDEMTRLLLPRGYRNAELLHHRLQQETEEKWNHRGQQRALHLFHAMAQKVPAYKEFRYNFERLIGE